MLVLYVYTVALICVLVLSAAFSGAAYAVSKNLLFLFEALLLCFYLFELVFNFGEEWLMQNISLSDVSADVGSDKASYSIYHPVFRIAISCGLVYLFLLLSRYVAPFQNDAVPVALACAFVLLEIAVVAGPFAGAVRQWLFYALRTGFFVVSMLRLGWCVAKGRGNAVSIVRRRRALVGFVAVMLPVIVLEDVLVVLVLPVPGDGANQLIILLQYRNIAENLMVLGCGASFAHQALSFLALHFERPVGFGERAKDAPADAEALVDVMLPTYAEAHGLTKRETEVLACVLHGMSNRAIAEELFVVEGTVKTHLHNIMKKVGVSGRDELKRVFWEG